MQDIFSGIKLEVEAGSLKVEVKDLDISDCWKESFIEDLKKDSKTLVEVSASISIAHWVRCDNVDFENLFKGKDLLYLYSQGEGKLFEICGGAEKVEYFSNEKVYSQVKATGGIINMERTQVQIQSEMSSDKKPCIKGKTK